MNPEQPYIADRLVRLPRLFQRFARQGAVVRVLRGYCDGYRVVREFSLPDPSEAKYAAPHLAVADAFSTQSRRGRFALDLFACRQILWHLFSDW